jgi:hypothetical protein
MSVPCGRAQARCGLRPWRGAGSALLMPPLLVLMWDVFMGIRDADCFNWELSAVLMGNARRVSGRSSCFT